MLLSLLFLFYQDWKYRAVYWLTFPVIFVLFISFSYSKTGINELAWHSGLNLAFLLLQIIILTLYFSLKQRKLIILTRSHLGLGDILFLSCTAFYLSPLNYLIFYISSLCFVLLFTAATRLRKNNTSWKIPLAGIQALFLAVICLADWTHPYIDLGSDNWLLRLFTRFI